MSEATGNYQAQKERIERVARELAPGCKIKWDESVGPNWLRFGVELNGVVLVKGYPHWQVSEIADKSDDDLRKVLTTISGGLIGPRNPD